MHCQWIGGAKPVLAAAALLVCVACSSSTRAPDRFFATFWTDITCPDPSGHGEEQSGGPSARCAAMVVEVRRDWAPLGVDRFYEIVNEGYFNNSAFFRVAPDFVVQFGISGTHDGRWHNVVIDDDPTETPSSLSNMRGTLSFAIAGPNTRTTQVFVNLADNTFLDHKNFAAFGTVTWNLELMQRVINPTPGATDGVDQDAYYEHGNTWFAEHYLSHSMIRAAAVTCIGDDCDAEHPFAEHPFAKHPFAAGNRAQGAASTPPADSSATTVPPPTARPRQTTAAPPPADGLADPELSGASVTSGDEGKVSEKVVGASGEAEEIGRSPGEVVGLVVAALILVAAAALVAAKAAWKRGYAPLQTYELGMKLYEIGDEDSASDSGSESDGMFESSYGPASADVSFDEGDPPVFDSDGDMYSDGPGGGGGGAWPTASSIELEDDGAYSHDALQSALEDI